MTIFKQKLKEKNCNHIYHHRHPSKHFFLFNTIYFCYFFNNLKSKGNEDINISTTKCTKFN